MPALPGVRGTTQNLLHQQGTPYREPGVGAGVVRMEHAPSLLVGGRCPHTRSTGRGSRGLD